MSFMFRDRKDTEFDYGSTFCPYKDGCGKHNCAYCKVFVSEHVRDRKDNDLENFYAGGL